MKIKFFVWNIADFFKLGNTSQYFSNYLRADSVSFSFYFLAKIRYASQHRHFSLVCYICRNS